MDENQNTRESAIEETVSREERQKDIILYNDDVNTFDFVIKALVKVCHHDLIQAEQCTHIIHYNGKCSVKRGSYKNLEPICLKLLDLGLSAKIE